MSSQAVKVFTYRMVRAGMERPFVAQLNRLEKVASDARGFLGCEHLVQPSPNGKRLHVATSVWQSERDWECWQLSKTRLEWVKQLRPMLASNHETHQVLTTSMDTTPIHVG